MQIKSGFFMVEPKINCLLHFFYMYSLIIYFLFLCAFSLLLFFNFFFSFFPFVMKMNVRIDFPSTDIAISMCLSKRSKPFKTFSCCNHNISTHSNFSFTGKQSLFLVCTALPTTEVTVNSVCLQCTSMLV